MKWVALSALVCAPLLGEISLDEMMSQRQLQETGVDQLNYSQKQALEEWLDAHFKLRDDRPKKEEDQLYLSLNVGEGRKLELSDGTSYEIAPEDRIYSSYWITPFPVMVSPSGNADYPVKITNLNTGTFVKGKKISTETLIHEDFRNPKTPKEKPKKK